MLDNVIDINYYPAEAAKRSNKRHRPVGLGMMGMQEALYMRRTPFDSPEAVDFHDEIIEAIAFYAYSASADLAVERGVYTTYPGSKWERGLLPLDTLEHVRRRKRESLSKSTARSGSIGILCGKKFACRACAILTASL